MMLSAGAIMMNATPEPRVATVAATGPLTTSADVSREEWDAYVKQHPNATGNHLWSWRKVYQATYHHRTEYLAARRPNGAIAGILPLVVFDHPVFGRFMVSLPFVNYGGVLADDEIAARALVAEATERAKWHGLKHIELRHHTQHFEHLPVKHHKVSMTLDLPRDVDVAWDGLDRKIRNQVRKAEKSGLTTEVGGGELLADFYAVFAEQMRDLGTPVYPRQWFEEIFRCFPEHARVVLVRHGNKAVAGAVTFAFGSSIEVPSAADLRSHRSMCPNMLLYWGIMQYAIASGIRVLDFGRSTPDEGTYRFKKQWGATPGPMAWEYVMMSDGPLPDRSPKNSRFSSAIAIWRRLPLRITNAIGPEIVRFLP